MTQNDTKNAYLLYLRVSTTGQGRSGLGISGQREAVERFVVGRGGHIVAEFVEIESGKRNDRPELEKAIRRCRLTGSTLVVAKLDRLSRNAAFLMTLRDAGVNFVAADMPEANTMTVGVMAVVAQHEAEAISARTKAALAAAKSRGTVLGGYRTNAPDISLHTKKANQAVSAKALRDAEDRRDLVEALMAEGLSLTGIAVRLNEARVRTPRGGAWTSTTVSRTLRRLEVQSSAA